MKIADAQFGTAIPRAYALAKEATGMDVAAAVMPTAPAGVLAAAPAFRGGSNNGR